MDKYEIILYWSNDDPSFCRGGAGTFQAVAHTGIATRPP